MSANNAVEQAGKEAVLRLKQGGSPEQWRVFRTRTLPRVNGARWSLEMRDGPVPDGELWHFDAGMPRSAEDVRASLLRESACEVAVIAVRQVDTGGIEMLRDLLEGISVSGLACHYRGSWLAESSQKLEEARDLAESLAYSARRLSEARDLMRQPSLFPSDVNGRAAVVSGQLVELLDDIECVLADYHRFEVRLVESVMRARRADCELEAREFSELAEQVKSVRRQLDSSAWGLGWLLGRLPSRRQRERLSRRLQRLTERQARDKVFVDAYEVRAWLDTLVDASLYLPLEQWKEEAREARFLFYQLLNVHCLQSLMRAERIAVDVVLRPDGHDVYGYCTGTERYLKHYFDSQRRDGAAAGYPAGPIRQVRDAMLTEYREHARSD